MQEVICLFYAILMRTHTSAEFLVIELVEVDNGGEHDRLFIQQ